jgi:hypothetical protein
MAFSVPASSLIEYPPSAMASFPMYAFEWIDNLHFVLPPDRFILDPSAYIAAARTAFLEAGWDGDGEIGVMWLPPFVFPLGSRSSWVGVMLWHVKQLEDGISWLLSPIELPFEGFARWIAESWTPPDPASV